jgi:sec-independent protein translocase protein TatA
MGRIGIGELVILAMVIVLLFGASRLPEIGKGLADGIRNLKKGLRDDEPSLEGSPAKLAEPKGRDTGREG